MAGRGPGSWSRDDRSPRPITSADEIEHYDRNSSTDESYKRLLVRLEEVRSAGEAWGEPPGVWLDTHYDSVAQEDVNRHLAPRIRDSIVLQIGGVGTAVLKALIGGASYGHLVTPSSGEISITQKAATHHGLSKRFSGQAGFAENLPLEDESVDAVISEGSLHHTDVGQALSEIARVLKPAGRFAAFDPWHARLYDIGIAVFGKRDPGVECRPLNVERLSDLRRIFPDSSVIQHGPATRYPLVALGKLGVEVPRPWVHRIIRADDRITSRIGPLARNGSSVAVLATKTEN